MKESIILLKGDSLLEDFVADMIQSLHDKELYDGKIVAVETEGSKAKLTDCLENRELFHCGLKNGEDFFQKSEINCISRFVNPYTSFEDFLALTKQPSFRFIITASNENAYRFDNKCGFDDRPANSFSAMLTQLLYQRYLKHLSGFVVLSCEPVSDNAKLLKASVVKYATLWELGDDFLSWLENENDFCSSVVDRMASACAKNQLPLSYELESEKEAVTLYEPYHLWAIEGDYENELPFVKAGLNISWSDEVLSFYNMRTRIFDGAYSVMLFPGLICEKNCFSECADDELLFDFFKHCVYDCIVPALGDAERTVDYAKSLSERFANPYINISCKSALVGALARFRKNVLPSVEDYLIKRGVLPKALVFTLSCLIYYYKNNIVTDDIESATFIAISDLETVLSDVSLWGIDLSEMKNLIEKGITMIENHGIEQALRWAIND